MSYNVGIIGAARRHQGTGPYIARKFAQLGHNIVGIVGTSEQSTQQAAQHLLENYAIKTDAHSSFDQLCQQQSLDILVIASPPNTHLSYLEQALEYGCHIFCEKPLWWPSNQISKENYLLKIQHIIDRAREQHCLVHLNTQWPYTLKDFNQLYPTAISNNQIHQFAMWLSPQSSGSNMLIDAASHGLSMLYQLVGSGELDDIQVTSNDNSTRINFSYRHQAGLTNCELLFIQSNETPKPASYQINGCSVKRIVALPEYQIQLQSEQQITTIHDPLDASIEDFLASIDASIEIDDIALSLGARHLYKLIEYFNKS